MRRTCAGLLALVLAACGGKPAPATAPAAAPLHDYGAELAALDAEIAASRRQAEKTPDSWMALEGVAQLQLTRGQLSGDYRDYAGAGQTLQAALARARPPAGPCRSRVRQALSVHRVPEAAALQPSCRNPLDPLDPADLLLAGDIARQQGRYAEALAQYRVVSLYRDNAEAAMRLALLYAHTGAPMEADALLQQAEQASSRAGAQLRAWIALQRGLLQLDRGRLDLARQHYRRADSLLPGWWLVEEHLAELLALEGKANEARRAYEAIVARTGNPEFMDALAKIEADAGKPEAARQWLERARQGYRERMAVLPEAAFGHALEHFLQAPEDAGELLQLARRNAALRPDGEALTLLALAQLRNGLKAEATQTVERLLASGWSTAPAHYAAYEVLQAAGRSSAAAEQRQRALALNPRSARMYAQPWLDAGAPPGGS